jgi:hypothetical protein
MTQPPKPRNYCFLMRSHKYNRNAACKAHDNAYGIYGGGNEQDRKRADEALLRAMQSEGDPLARIAYFFVRCFGWFFFNYHGRPWRGQLSKKWRSSSF